MAIDEFLRNVKQQVLDHLKSNPNSDDERE
jgi:hypothetical protein